MSHRSFLLAQIEPFNGQLSILKVVSPDRMCHANQDHSINLDRLIAWFREGSDSDPVATLAFPASLSKFQRARVHSLVKSIGLGSLQSVSKGVGDDRFISIERSRDEDQSCLAQMTSAQHHKSFWIYRWAKEAGVLVSRDEVSEMILSTALTPQLEQLWNKGSAQQKLIIKLCEAVVEGDTAALKVLWNLQPLYAQLDSRPNEVIVQIVGSRFVIMPAVPERCLATPSPSSNRSCCTPCRICLHRMRCWRPFGLESMI